MDLDDWHDKVSPHLDKIWAGADMALRHTEALPIRPGFFSLAEDQLDACEKTLTHALQTVRLAQAIFGNKPVEGADD
jgi:hypothetical protein